MVAHDRAERVQRQRAALVDAVVEHQGRTRIGEQQVLVQLGEPGVVVGGLLGGAVAAGLLGPEPLGIAGEPLVQPDVLPLAQGDGVAEPLVRELVGDEPDRVPVARGEVAPERRERLRLQRDLERVVGHHGRVVVEGVGPEDRLEEGHHRRLLAERGVITLATHVGRRDHHHTVG